MRAIHTAASETEQMFKTSEMIEQMQGRPLTPYEKSMIWLAYSTGRLHAEIAFNTRQREQTPDGDQ